jgi:hypothetical protein
LIDAKIDTSPKALKKFGHLFAAVCALVALFLWWKESSAWHWVLLGIPFFLGTGYLAQPVLKPLYVGWMKFAFVLGWINTRILLTVFYYLVLTPIGLILKLRGRDLLARKPDTRAASYWIKRERRPFAPARYEKQF